MKSMKKFAATAALTIAAVAVASGTAAADVSVAADRPGATVSTDVLPGIHYTANVVDHSVVLRTDAGRLTVRGAQLEVLDAQGNLALGMPLTYRLDQKDWPIAAQIDADGRTVTLTPSTDPAAAAAVTEAKPIFSQDDFNDALSVAGTQIGLATAIGGMVGAAIGLAGGCVAGAVVGTTLMPPAFLVGAPGGCIAGAGVGAGLGTAIGTLAVGIPVTVVSVIQVINTLNAAQG
ncbi:hypothetical protein [Nocardia sp. NBC_01327]|uniref:hypothetical protein n=1 Tax=Nocardia sp. NBC_01327 TaxID=2903593 RepID=UPI002E115FBF|nr:hypothetical protein OG326_05835 [Nocardia sp. NBC_01327]